VFILPRVGKDWVVPFAKPRDQIADAKHFRSTWLTVSQRANATTLSFMSRLAQGAGATPWTILAQTPRLWASTADDGAISIERLGPKEARIDMVGYPLSGIRYNRISMQGIVLAVVELFCKKAYVREIASMCSERSLGMRVSWV
jgi:hypothetical protein